MADMCRKGLHEMVEGNLIYEGTTRRCMACRRRWSADYYEANRQRILKRQRQDREKAAAARPPRTHCRNGHPVTGRDATYEKANGSRGCRACARAAAHRYLDRHRSDPEWRDRQRDMARRRYASDSAYRERILEHARAYREANRDAISERRRAYRDANREDICWSAQVRYATDPEYRERVKADSRDRYAAQRAANARTVVIPATLEDAVKRLGGEA